MKADRDKYLTSNQFRRLLAAARGTGHAALRERNYRLLCIAGNLGLRVSEVLDVRVSDCELETRTPTLRVRRRKAKHLQHLPVNRALLPVVRGAVRACNVSAESFARAWDAKLFPVSSRTAQYVFKAAARAAGLLERQPELSFHALRHFRGLQLLEATDNPAAIQKLMGHRSAKSTFFYYHLDPEREAEVNSKAGAIV